MKLEALSCSSNSSESSTSDLIESFPPLEATVSPKENINSLYSNNQWHDKIDSASSTLSSSNSGKLKEKFTTELAIESVAGMTASNKASELNSAYVRGRPSACVFVASLCSNMSDDALCVSVTDHFKQWGTLATVKVLRDTCNRPYAFVQYTTDSDSKLAIEKGHNSVLDGRNIRCEAAKVNRTLFVSSKSFLSKSIIRDRLSNFGEIEELLPSTSKGELYNSGVDTRGYKNWFCKFTYRDDAIRAYANLTEEGIYKVDWTQNIDKSNAPRNINEPEQDSLKVKFDKYSIFVGQLSLEVSEDQLSQRFERHGEILDLNLIKRTNNTFAFIKFKRESSAAGAVERENHSMFCGKTMHVQYRETHIHAPIRTRSNYNNGIPLAPPPINLNKKSFPKNDYVKSKGMIEMSKPKFNSYPSNSFNKGFNKLKQFKSFRPGSYEKKFGNTKTESTWHASQLNLKSEVSESSQVEKKASGDIRVPSAPNESRGSGASSRNNSSTSFPPPPPTTTTPGFPLFYYVPADNVNFANSSSANPPPFYNVYPQYYPATAAAAAAAVAAAAAAASATGGANGNLQYDTPGCPPSGVANVVAGSLEFSLIASHPSYGGIANYMYYPNELEMNINDKKV